GAPTSITATSMFYGNGLPDVVTPINFNEITGVRWGVKNGNFLEGRYFDNGDVFVRVDDPQCATIASTLTTRCTLDALAMVVPAGTADSFTLSDGRTAKMVVQQAQPGKKGNLGNNSIVGLGTWRFDANLGKTFQISESK